jgi:hypothetical protein
MPGLVIERDRSGSHMPRHAAGLPASIDGKGLLSAERRTAATSPSAPASSTLLGLPKGGANVRAAS